MTRLLMLLSITVLFLAGNSHARIKHSRDASISDAVKEFNARVQSNAIGKTQPPLTEDEVVAAIHGWDRERFPAPDDVYKSYQRMADTKNLPPGTKLDFIDAWIGFNGHDFDVWWVDLITESAERVHVLRIRDQKLRCKRSGS